MYMLHIYEYSAKCGINIKFCKTIAFTHSCPLVITTIVAIFVQRSAPFQTF